MNEEAQNRAVLVLDRALQPICVHTGSASDKEKDALFSLLFGQTPRACFLTSLFLSPTRRDQMPRSSRISGLLYRLI